MIDALEARTMDSRVSLARARRQHAVQPEDDQHGRRVALRREVFEGWKEKLSLNAAAVQADVERRMLHAAARVRNEQVAAAALRFVQRLRELRDVARLHPPGGGLSLEDFRIDPEALISLAASGGPAFPPFNRPARPLASVTSDELGRAADAAQLILDTDVLDRLQAELGQFAPAGNHRGLARRAAADALRMARDDSPELAKVLTARDAYLLAAAHGLDEMPRGDQRDEGRVKDWRRRLRSPRKT